MVSLSCPCLSPYFGRSLRARSRSSAYFEFHGFHQTMAPLQRFGGRNPGFVPFAYHCNPRIIKSNRRRSRYGDLQPTCYYEEDEGNEDDDDIDDYAAYDLEQGEINHLNPKLVDIVTRGKSLNMLSGARKACPEVKLRNGKAKGNVLPKTGERVSPSRKVSVNSPRLQAVSLKLSRKEWEKRAFEIIQQQKLRNLALNKKHGEKKISPISPQFENIDQNVSKLKTMHSLDANMNEKGKAGKIDDLEFHWMAKQLGLEGKWQPLIEYLSSLGLNESHFARIHDRHKPSLQTKVASARDRLEFLLSLGVKTEDLMKIILRQPQILEYTVKHNMKPHVDFLRTLGVPDSRLGRIITVAPSLFSYSVERSLKPKVKFLVEEVGIKREDLGKVVVLSPHILTQRIEESMQTRLDFLSKELGASKESLAKMVSKHPQLLHYSIRDGIQPRINFLRSIGMSNSDIVKVLTRLTQILSLSVENSLRPKYWYLVKELNNGISSLTSYPAYFSLSLEQRIWPRHRFLIALKKVSTGPFPLAALIVTDDSFCEQWAHSTLEEYQAFRQQLLLSKLTRKFAQKHRARL